MQARSPFSFPAGFGVGGASPWQPPDWLVDEIQQRLLLLINHVLAQEAEATRRLSRVKGQTLLLRWRNFFLGLAVTPAGLLERAAADAAPDLTLTLTEASPLSLAQAALRGHKPPVRIEGDVQLATEINWLIDHVRWDLEEDLSRLIGDAPARALGLATQRMVTALRDFAGSSGAPPPPQQ